MQFKTYGKMLIVGNSPKKRRLTPTRKRAESNIPWNWASRVRPTRSCRRYTAIGNRWTERTTCGWQGCLENCNSRTRPRDDWCRPLQDIWNRQNPHRRRKRRVCRRQSHHRRSSRKVPGHPCGLRKAVSASSTLPRPAERLLYSACPGHASRAW
jgi:hypothetical protein